MSVSSDRTRNKASNKHLYIGFLSLTATFMLYGCHNKDTSANQTTTSAVQQTSGKQLSLMAQIGQKLFYEKSLSASGQMSCASCHNPNHAFAPTNDLPAQFGGPDLKLQGARAVPNLTYMLHTPDFSVGPDLDTNEALKNTKSSTNSTIPAADIDPNKVSRVATGVAKAAGSTATTAALVPQGGFFWDGRVDTLQGQAIGPLLNPLEMSNPSEKVLIAKLKKLPYLADLQKLAGPNVLTDDKLLLSESMFAIARYEAEEPAFAPYSSKYDQYLDGKTQLSAAEMRGLKLFEDPNKGNCSSCHLDKKSKDGQPPLFTDYQYEALGVPRNMALKVNANPHYFDLGICGPARNDIYSKQSSNCGLFKTPSLRNVATRHAFFHNGIYHNLNDVLHFYVERDIHPEKFYPSSPNGQVNKFNDIPTRYRANIDVVDAPFNRKPGDAPALNDAEIQDVIAFLKTLNDGYSAKPSSSSK